MSENFTIEMATNEQWLDVLDYIFETEPSQLKVLAGEANYNDFLDDDDLWYALEAGGVDSWSGYDEAIDMADADDNDWSSLSNNEKLDYLFAAGVDNWSWFSESIDGALNELFTSTYPSALDNVMTGKVIQLAKLLAKTMSSWHDYITDKFSEQSEFH